jgi:hypothetical protein
MTNIYKVIKINKTTNETEILTDNNYLEIARMIARTNKEEGFEVKIINNRTNEEKELEAKPRKTFERNYKTNTRICRNNYIKLY